MQLTAMLPRLLPEDPNALGKQGACLYDLANDRLTKLSRGSDLDVSSTSHWHSDIHEQRGPRTTDVLYPLKPRSVMLKGSEPHKGN